VKKSFAVLLLAFFALPAWAQEKVKIAYS